MNRFNLESIKDKMLNLTEQNSLSWEHKKELADDTSDEFRMEPWETEEAFREVGAPICKKDDDLFLPDEEAGHGTSVFMSKKACKKHGGERVGTFHTHPTPPITPSTPDLRLMHRNEDQVACIGTKASEKTVVACFEEPGSNIIGAEKLELKRTMKSFGDFGGKKRGITGDKIGEINVWEDSSPTPREILEEYPFIIEDSAREGGVSEEELKEELREGRMPEPIQRAQSEAPNEYDKVDLNVFSKESERENLESEISELKQNFVNVRVFENDKK